MEVHKLYGVIALFYVCVTEVFVCVYVCRIPNFLY